MGKYGVQPKGPKTRGAPSKKQNRQGDEYNIMKGLQIIIAQGPLKA